ncbi:hypothetical protein VitviT2T_027356 [Vitis vinifera]|uniref:Uncharacterized protein n=1 Tax=Vitis vinifera TaxID=29760 RepID=A0ABY9DTK3_VITVI|nr:hypothetical protein VitviT2T_027356 [Vitis vinifera]
MDPKKPGDEEEGGLLSCWGNLKLKFPCNKGRRNTQTRHRRVGWKIMEAFKPKRPKPFSSFRYDPLSYAQNFDDGCWDEDCEGSSNRGFSARFAVPSSKPLGD